MQVADHLGNPAGFLLFVLRIPYDHPRGRPSRRPMRPHGLGQSVGDGFGETVGCPHYFRPASPICRDGEAGHRRVAIRERDDVLDV